MAHVPRTRSGSFGESRLSLAEVDGLAEDLAEDDDLTKGDLAEVNDDDLAKDDDLVEALAEVAAGYLADVKEDDLAEFPSQGGLETGLLRCCQPY